MLRPIAHSIPARSPYDKRCSDFQSTIVRRQPAAGERADAIAGDARNSALAALVHQQRFLQQVDLAGVVTIDVVEQLANFVADAAKFVFLPFAQSNQAAARSRGFARGSGRGRGSANRSATARFGFASATSSR